MSLSMRDCSNHALDFVSLPFIRVPSSLHASYRRSTSRPLGGVSYWRIFSYLHCMVHGSINR